MLPSYPSDDLQRRPDTAEMAAVAGHQNGADGEGVGGDHHVQLADRLADAGEGMADAGILGRRGGRPIQSRDEGEKSGASGPSGVQSYPLGGGAPGGCRAEPC